MFNQFIKKIERDAYRRKRLRSKRQKSLLRQKTLQKKLVNRKKKRTTSGMQPIYITWIPGSYDSECGFTIVGKVDGTTYLEVVGGSFDDSWKSQPTQNDFGQEILDAGQFKVIEVPGNQTYTITGTDSYGDGWNGAVLSINLTEALTDTVATGESLLEMSFTLPSSTAAATIDFTVDAVAAVAAETMPVRVVWQEPDMRPGITSDEAALSNINFTISSDVTGEVYMEVKDGRLVGNAESFEYWFGGHNMELPVNNKYIIQALDIPGRGWSGALKFQIQTSDSNFSDYLFFQEGFTHPAGLTRDSTEGEFNLLATISETLEEDIRRATQQAAAAQAAIEEEAASKLLQTLQLPIFTTAEFNALKINSLKEGMIFYFDGGRLAMLIEEMKNFFTLIDVAMDQKGSRKYINLTNPDGTVGENLQQVAYEDTHGFLAGLIAGN